MVAQCYLRPRLQPGDEIVVSEAEHHANLVPWLMVAEQTGARVVKLPLGADLLPDVAQLPTLLNARSRLLALGQMSNVTGGCPDLAQAIRTGPCRRRMVVMVDGAQGVVHFPADVQALDIDFYAFSGHKLYGPTGIGALYGKAGTAGKDDAVARRRQDDHRSVVRRFHPAKTAALLRSRYAERGGGDWLKRGAGVAGSEQDMAQAESWSRGLATLAEEELKKRPGFRSFRVQDSSLLAFDFAGVHHSDMVTLLAE